MAQAELARLKIFNKDMNGVAKKLLEEILKVLRKV
jgi:hypothetical protein